VAEIGIFKKVFLGVGRMTVGNDPKSRATAQIVCGASGQLGRVDEFGSDEIFGIPRLNQA
jgi:hypothetical protein